MLQQHGKFCLGFVCVLDWFYRKDAVIHMPQQIELFWLNETIIKFEKFFFFYMVDSAFSMLPYMYTYFHWHEFSMS